MSLLWRISNAIMALFFALATYVQNNDRYALFWMLVYFIPFLIALIMLFDFTWAQTKRVQHLLYLLLIIYLSFTIYLAFYAIEIVSRTSNFSLLQHQECKEFFGALIIDYWLLACCLMTNIRTPLASIMNNSIRLVIIMLSCLPFALWTYHQCFPQWPFNDSNKTITI